MLEILKDVHETVDKMAEVYWDRRAQLMQEAIDNGTLERIIKGGLISGSAIGLVGKATNAPIVEGIGYGIAGMSGLYGLLIYGLNRSSSDDKSQS
ncbi:MAG: hypothetical protein ABIA93_05170 [Candidatus Woesearchaeota archaeon]